MVATCDVNYRKTCQQLINLKKVGESQGMGEKLNLKHVMQSELSVKNSSKNELYGFITIFIEAINTFFQLPYYIIAQSDDPSSPLGQYEFFCSMHYYQAPYTFLPIYHLWIRGYYYECVILIRNLLESFVQIRYFEDKKCEIENYLKVKGKNRIRLKTMFENLSPGLYDNFYSQLSNFAHGGISKEIFRTTQESSNLEERIIILGCQFDMDKATYVINILNVLLHGYFKYFIIIFPEGRSKMIKEKLPWQSYNNIISKTSNAIDSHKKCCPNSKEWYKLILPLIYQKNC